MASGLSSPDGFHLSQTGRSHCGKANRAYWQGFQLDLKEEGGNIKLACVKVWNGIARLEGQGACGSPQLTALRHAGKSAVRLKYYDNEPGTIESTGEGNRETQGKYF